MKRFKEGNKALRSTLVLCFIYFYMQTHEICGDLLDYLIANFQNPKENDPKIEKYILEVLEVSLGTFINSIERKTNE